MPAEGGTKMGETLNGVPPTVGTTTPGEGAIPGAAHATATENVRARLDSIDLLRGLWLIFLEFTVARAAIYFNFDYREIGVAQVIRVIGVSMIVLAGLIHLPSASCFPLTNRRRLFMLSA